MLDGYSTCLVHWIGEAQHSDQGPGLPNSLWLWASLLGVMITAILFLSTISAPEPGRYQPSRAPLAVETRAGLELPREGLRALSYRVTWPKTGGPYPVLVISHGMYGSEDGLLPLTQHWASYGYVVFQPTHDDSLRYADPEMRRAALRGETNNIGSRNQRPKDVSLILDSLGKIEKAVPELKGKIDSKVVGMGGHSFGAWTTQVVAGMKHGLRGTTMSDPRLQAFLAISPHGVQGGITKEGLAAMRGPMMGISGDKDDVRGMEDIKTFRQGAFYAGPKGQQTLVWIKDADHGFGGINGREGANRSRNPKHVQMVQDAGLAWWDAKLKRDAAAEKWLREKEIEKLGGVQLLTR